MNIESSQNLETNFISHLGMRNFKLNIPELASPEKFYGEGEMPFSKFLLRPDSLILNGGATAAFIESLASWTSSETLKLINKNTDKSSSVGIVGLELNVQHLRPLFWEENVLLKGKAEFIQLGQNLHTLSVEIHSHHSTSCKKKIAFAKMIMMLIRK